MRRSIPPAIGRLTFITEIECLNRMRRVRCRCECGTMKDFYLSNYASGKSKSCGCAQFSGDHSRTHGLSKTAIYLVWNSMVMRCTNPKASGYAKYGAKGITVCERWRTFENFYADMGERPSRLHSLDRINNSLGYTPGNVRWATMQTQQRNRTSNAVHRMDGEAKTLAEWCEIYGAPHSRVIHRMESGWTFEQAVKAPKNARLRSVLSLSA